MIKILLKFLFAGGIIYYLVQNGSLDFSLVGKMTSNHLGTLIITFCLYITTVLLSSVRWKILLKIQSKKKLPILSIIRLTWIGAFFSSVLPGAVTGDLIKLVYAKDVDPDLNKTFLITTALMDRIIGLIGLLFLLGIFSIFNFTEITSLSPQMAKLVYLNFLLFIGVIAFFFTLFFPSKWQGKILELVNLIPIIGKHTRKTLEQVWIIGRSKKSVITCLIMSIIMQANMVFMIWFIARPFFDAPLSLYLAYTFVPLGLMAIAIPISPAGLGVGHAIFGSLFSYYGITGGASLFNLYFLVMITVNLMGLIPYLYSGKRHTINETNQFDDMPEPAT